MTITAAQLAARAEGIGASEVGAILGVDPYRSAWDVWAEKTGKLEPETRTTDAMDLGNELEPLLLKRCSLALGKPVVKTTGTFKAANGIMFANLDGMVGRSARGSENVECKSSMLPDGWGDAGTDQVPDRVLTQVTTQMFCADSPLTHISRADTRFGLKFSLYLVTFNPELSRILEDRVCEFWRKYVLTDTPPPDSPPTLEVAKRLRRTLGAVREVPVDLVRAVIDRRASKLAAEKESKAADAALIAALGDAEIGECALGSIEYREVSRKGYTVDATTFRQLKLPKGA